MLTQAELAAALELDPTRRNARIRRLYRRLRRRGLSRGAGHERAACRPWRCPGFAPSRVAELVALLGGRAGTAARPSTSAWTALCRCRRATRETNPAGVRFWIREYGFRNLQVLCHYCNSVKRRHLDWRPPFGKDPYADA